jgi:hypothetical protein
MHRFPARSKTPRASKLTNVPALSETTPFMSGRKRVRRNSLGVHELFDMEAKNERLHDANATDSPVDSDVPTTVIVDDDAVEVRQSSKALQVDGDVVKFASQLSPANKVRLLELLTNKPDVVHLDAVSSLPEGALPLSEFVEVVMPSANCLCGVNALKVFLSVILGKPHAPLASKMRETLFEALPCYFHVPIVNDMTYEQWARVHNKSAENMLQEELRKLPSGDDRVHA